MTRRSMRVGDVIKITAMPLFPKFKPPLYALAIERRPTNEDPDYYRLLIVEGSYSEDRVPGTTFHLPGMPREVSRTSLDWHIVPPQSVPDRIWVEIAKWRLLR